MNDLKIYAAIRSHLVTKLMLIHRLSSDISMAFGVTKCQTVYIERGKLTQDTELKLD